jgi:probable HAF family extracellular repeat protein
MGQVVGYGTVLTPLGFRHHAWLWSKGTMTDLGVPSAPGTPPGSTLAPLPPGALKLFALPSTFQNSVAAAINNNGKIVGWANMAPVASTLFMKSPYGWGTAVAYDTNKSAKAPGLAFGWNILSMPSVTVGAPLAPLGLVGPPPSSSMLAAFAINDSDQMAGWFIKPGPLTAGFLLTAPLPLKP